MEFNNDITKQGIVQRTLWESSATIVSYPIEDIVSNTNEGLNRFQTMAMEADSRWQFDDTNYTTLPIGTTDLVSGQQDYTFDDDYLIIRSIQLSDTAGNFTTLIPYDESDPIQAEEIAKNTSGVPKYYDKMGESILLYPKPNYNYTAGLRAYFARKMSYFTTDDTTKTAGIPVTLQYYLVIFNAFMYAVAKGTNKAVELEKRLMKYEGNKAIGGSDIGDIKRHYSRREKDFKPRLRINNESNK